MRQENEQFQLTNVQFVIAVSPKQEGCTFIPPVVATVVELFFCLLSFDLVVSQSHIQEPTSSNDCGEV